MIGPRATFGRWALLAIAVLTMGLGPTRARDYGQAGQTFAVIEPDLLSTIEARLRRAEASGALARANQMFASRVAARVRRPAAVKGITKAQQARSWDFDPSITLERDIRDQEGNLVASAGHKVNPLDFITVRQDLVFIDGDDKAEMLWATARYSDMKAKIIFVRGSPIEAMTSAKRRFYFDQDGMLTGRLGIRHTPAIATPNGRVMRVSEHVIARGGAG